MSTSAAPERPDLLSAVIFDLDGLLVDTEPLWHEAEVDVLGALGVPLERAQTRRTKGMFVTEVVRFWYERYPWSGPGVDEVATAVADAVQVLATQRGRLRPGATAVIEAAGARSLGAAVASSSPMAYIEAVLASVGLGGAFAVVRSAEVEPFGKPHPGVFLAAAADLGVAPERCVVFEDAPAGVLAAKSARMRCVAVPDPEDRCRPEMGLADLVLASLEEMDASCWARLGPSPAPGLAPVI